MKIPSVVKEAVGWAVVIALTGVLLFLVFGCAAVPTAEDPPGVVYVPGWPADPETGAPDTTGFPWWAQAAVGVGVALAAPRTRRNLLGAASALLRGEGKRAGVHLAALTPFVGSPVEALPKAQQEIIETANPARTDDG